MFYHHSLLLIQILIPFTQNCQNYSYVGMDDKSRYLFIAYLMSKYESFCAKYAFFIFLGWCDCVRKFNRNVDMQLFIFHLFLELKSLIVFRIIIGVNIIIFKLTFKIEYLFTCFQINTFLRTTVRWKSFPDFLQTLASQF